MNIQKEITFIYKDYQMIREQAGFVEPHSSSTIGWVGVEVGSGFGWFGVGMGDFFWSRQKLGDWVGGWLAGS